MKYLKHRFVWVSALALAFTITSQVQTMGLTNGTICIITRMGQDLTWVHEDGDRNDGWDYKGPGQTTPGDVAMGELLADFGYSIRVTISREVFAGASNNYTGIEFYYPGEGHTIANPLAYLHPTNSVSGEADTNFDVALIIQSGSGAGNYSVPMRQYGVPIMCGEHQALSDRPTKPGSIFMYKNGSQSSDAYGPAAGQYMKVLAPNHPIMQGIPLDAEGRVKVIRDAYPEENAHIPTDGYKNWGPYDYPVQWATNAAPATTVLGVLDTNTNRSCFAVADVGGLLSNGEANTARLVHFFVCEGGSGDSRRCFNALSDLGRVIFVRAAKWAMGETLTPYQPLGIIKVAQLNATQIQLAWTGTATKNYKILGTANILGPNNYLNWQTVAQDIPGVDGVDATTAKLDISAGPQYAYLRVMPVP